MAVVLHIGSNIRNILFTLQKLAVFSLQNEIFCLQLHYDRSAYLWTIYWTSSAWKPR